MSRARHGKAWLGDRGKGRALVRHALVNGPRVTPDIVGGEPFSILAWEEWMQRGRCLEVDPEIFYPPPGNAVQGRAAKAICRSCPVSGECLAHALKTREPYGIWGGKSAAERRVS